jgi:ubiquinone/menaquinone biosynthesis C-methylase UbiE
MRRFSISNEGYNVPEYVDYAEYYDYDHAVVEDIPFYLEYARETGGPILELACGMGRLLLQLAEMGYEVHGVDFSENMLEVARRKISEQDFSHRIKLTCANMADFELQEKLFALAFVAVRSFMHLYTQEDQLLCLDCVCRHLRPGGLFIVDVYSPNLGILTQPSGSDFKLRNEFMLPNGHRVTRKDRFVRNDFLNQINQWEMLFEEFDADGNLVRSRLVPMDTRYTFRFELQLLLEKAGFEVQTIFHDYEKHAYDGTGEIIAVAKKPE